MPCWCQKSEVTVSKLVTDCREEMVTPVSNCYNHVLQNRISEYATFPEAVHMCTWPLYWVHLAGSEFLPKIGVREILCKNALNHDEHI